MSFSKSARHVSPGHYPDYVGPLIERAVYPNDSGIHLSFPVEIKTPEQKVRFALWKEGRQSFVNLLLLTGLKTSELQNALGKLLATDNVSEIKADHVDTGCGLYKLNK